MGLLPRSFPSTWRYSWNLWAPEDSPEKLRQPRCVMGPASTSWAHSSQTSYSLSVTGRQAPSFWLALIQVSHPVPFISSSHNNPDEKFHLWDGVAQVFCPTTLTYYVQIPKKGFWKHQPLPIWVDAKLLLLPLLIPRKNKLIQNSRKLRIFSIDSTENTREWSARMWHCGFHSISNQFKSHIHLPAMCYVLGWRGILERETKFCLKEFTV